MKRRHFLGLVGAGAAVEGVSAAEPTAKVPLGFDNFSLRGLEWKAGKLLDFAAEQKCDVVLFSDLDVYESHDPVYLRELAAQAKEGGITLQAGTGGICPTGERSVTKYGTQPEHLRVLLKVARELGADVARCYLGFSGERSSPGGIRARIADTVEVLKEVKGEAIESGVAFAVENHAGDMQAHELRDLIEAAGPDFVGATIDPGNAAWTLEDPVRNLEILAPYAKSSGVRDTMVWQDEKGKIATQWMAVGEGNVDFARYFEIWRERCAGAPVVLETISQYGKTFAWEEDKFWEIYPEALAEDFAAYLRLAKSGRAVQKNAPDSSDQEAVKKFQMEELKRSLAICREKFGLGVKNSG